MKIKSLLLLGLLTLTGMNASAALVSHKANGIYYQWEADKLDPSYADGNAWVLAISSGMADATTITIPATFVDGDGNEHKVTDFGGSWTAYSGPDLLPADVQNIQAVTKTLSIDITNLGLFNKNIYNKLTALETLKLKGTLAADYEAPAAEFVTFKTLDLTELTGDGKKIKFGDMSAATALESITTGALATEITGPFANVTSIVLGGDATVAKDAFNSNAKIATFKVTGKATIGESAFQAATALTNAKFAVGAESTLGKNAFYGATGLTALVANVTKIGESAYEGCTGITEVNIPEAVTEIGNNAFKSIGANLKKVVINNNNLAEVKAWFADDNAINNVDITSTSIKKIAASAFEGAPVATLKLPTSLEEIGGAAFANFAKDELDLSTLTALKKVEKTSFKQNAYKKLMLNGTDLDDTNFGNALNWLAGSQASLATITLPEKVTKIPNNAFKDFTALKGITLPDAVVEIGEGAFNSAALESIDLNNVKKIGATAFVWTKIKSLIIPAAVESIGADAFSNIATLESVTITNDNLTKVDAWFANDAAIKTVSITGAKIKEIADNAFVAAPITTLTLPANLEKIGSKSFGAYASKVIDLSAQTALKEVAADAFPSIEYTNVLLKGTALDNENFEKAQAWLANAKASLKEITFPDALTEIGGFGGATGFTALTQIGLPKHLVTIKDAAFQNCSALESVKIKGDVKSIGQFAFDGCVKIAKVDFSGATDLETIGDYAFKDNQALTSVAIPAKVKTIGQSAFQGGLELASVDFSAAAALETIGKKAFADCPKLAAVDLSGVAADATVGESAFNGCGLTTVTIGNKVKEIGAQAFYNNKIETIDFTGAVSLTDIATKAFDKNDPLVVLDLDGAAALSNVAIDAFPQNAYTSVKTAGTLLYTADPLHDSFTDPFSKTNILAGANESLTELTFPAGYNTGLFSDFAYFENLTSITLPEGLDEIPDNAFKGAHIATFEVADNIKRVGKHAFDGSTLESIDFTKATALTEIDNYAFANTKFESVGLPKNLETIGENAFEKSALKSVKIKSHVKTIGAYAFNDCKDLENVNFEDANALETIGGMAFGGTNKLTAINLEGATALTSISDTWGVAFAANEYTSVKTAGTLLAGIDPVTDSYYDNFSAEFGTILANSKATLSEITLPAGLQIVDGHQFEGFTAIESISLPKGLKGIEPYAFAKSGLTAIKIRENVEYIGAHAFGGCENLATVNLSEAAALETIGEAAFAAYAFGDEDAPVIESVVIPAAVKTIDQAAFYNAAALATVDFSQAAALQTIGNAAFAGTAITAIDLTASPELTVIAGAFPANAYTSIKLAGTLLPIGQFASIDLSEATATLSEVTLPGANVEKGFDGVTYIPEDLFASVRYAGDPSDPETYKPFTALKSVSLPKSVKEIGNNAFRASGLTAFKFRENIEKIGLGAFADCADLATVNFSEATKLVQIGGTAFANTAIKEVVIPENENGDDLTIGGFAFADSKLKSFSAKSWAGDVAEGMFMNTKLTGIKFPVAITGIDDGAFSGCAKLESVVFQYGAKDAGLVNGIGDYAFRGCAALAALDLSTTKLAHLDSQYPFEGCTSLAEITFPEELLTINSNGIFADTPIEIFEAPTLESSGILFGGYSYLDDLGNVQYATRDADHANTTLKTVKIGGAIPSDCFAFCTALEEVEWFDNGEEVEDWAFNHCTGLKTFTFEPDDAILSLVVDDDAFYGCVPFVDFVTNANYFDYIATHHDGIAPMNTTFGDAKPTFVTTVQDKANANQFVAKYVNNGSTPVSIDAADAKVYSIYVDGDAAYFQACRTYDGKYIIQPAAMDRGNHVIIVTTEAKDVTVTRESRRLLYTYSGQTSIAFDDVYDSKEGDDLAAVQAGAGVTAGTYLYRLTNTTGQGFGFTFFKGSTIKEGQFFVACSKKPSGAGRLNVVWLDENGNVESETTGIETIEANGADNDAIFNMQGVRVDKAQKGVYIQNGKKVVVK